MATIEHVPTYQPTVEACTIWIEEMPCIGCGEPQEPQCGRIALETQLRRLLCEPCRATLQAFRFLCKKDEATGTWTPPVKPIG